jgi:transposase-like protein
MVAIGEKRTWNKPDVLAFMSFPKDHRPKIHSTNPLELVPRRGSRDLSAPTER